MASANLARILAWQKRNPDKVRASYRRFKLKRNYGMTPEDYDRLLASQNNKCAICNAPPGKRRLAVDHDHETGRVRGLLCHHCNLTLGRVRDSIITLRAMIDYLERV